MSKNKKPLTRVELLAKLRAPESKVIDVPLLGSVRVQVPTWERIMEIRAQTSGSEEDFRWALAMASVVDLAPEDWAQLRGKNNGAVIGSLLGALLAKDSPITDDLVGK